MQGELGATQGPPGRRHLSPPTPSERGKLGARLGQRWDSHPRGSGPQPSDPQAPTGLTCTEQLLPPTLPRPIRAPKHLPGRTDWSCSRRGGPAGPWSPTAQSGDRHLERKAKQRGFATLPGVPSLAEVPGLPCPGAARRPLWAAPGGQRSAGLGHLGAETDTGQAALAPQWPQEGQLGKADLMALWSPAWDGVALAAHAAKKLKARVVFLPPGRCLCPLQPGGWTAQDGAQQAGTFSPTLQVSSAWLWPRHTRLGTGRAQATGESGG